MSGLNPSQIDEIRSELAKNRKISAVKKYRTWTNCSLLEAKNAVEAIQHNREVPQPSRQLGITLEDRQLRQIDKAIADRNKIEAVKLYKQFTGQSLSASKDFVEARMAGSDAQVEQTTNPSPNPSAIDSQRSGCFSSLLIVATLAAGLAAAFSFA
ncbi:MAG: hypothetical protein KDB00_10150 [Planctomycetales bacterium]|nr:hypothetical protein [Planctomycetales bacterium]